MGKNQARLVVVHPCREEERRALNERLAAFHAEFIERRLRAEGISEEQQLEVLEQIHALLRTGQETF